MSLQWNSGSVNVNQNNAQLTYNKVTFENVENQIFESKKIKRIHKREQKSKTKTIHIVRLYFALSHESNTTCQLSSHKEKLESKETSLIFETLFQNTSLET